MKKTASLLTLAAVAAGSAYAQTTFTFHDGSATTGTGSVFDNAEGSVQDTVGDFTLTAEAFLDGTSAGTDLNGAGTGFGVNAAGTGDETQRLDNDLGLESIVFSFSSGGTFESIDLRYIDKAANEGLLIFDGGNTYELNTTTALSGDDDFTIGETFTAGQSITLTLSGSAAAGENFSLENFTVSAVPEPGTYALLAGMLGLTAVMLRRRK